MPGCVIAGIKINMECEYPYLLRRMEAFASESHKKPEITITAVKTGFIEEPEGDAFIDDGHLVWLKRKEPEGYYLFQSDKITHRITVLMEVDTLWRKASISYATDDPAFIYNPFFMAGIVFRNYLLQHGGMVIHASSIAYQDRGILFTAPSGTGKSTHVGLWEQYLGSEVKVLNDDTPALRFLGEKLYLYGTPWSGSTQKYNNGSAPLKAIILLEQAQKNTIRQLSVKEALPRLMPRFFLPYFDDKMMGNAYDFIEKLLQTTPIYQLACRPDKEAMELAYHHIV